MNILVLCHFGQNRSRYLADYLMEEGYQDVQHAGIKDPDHAKMQKAIDQADIIITVSNHVRDSLRDQYQLQGKRIIDLQVEDRPEVVLPDHRQLDGNEWVEFQKNYVYPALKEQLSKYLPFF
jgi:hypothetical protein